VKRAKPAEVLAGFFQADVFANNANYIRLLLTLSANDPASAIPLFSENQCFA
jgi:hypothetical protein